MTSIVTPHLFGHDRMHKCPNQDHAMMTAMLAARSVLAGARLDGLWKVNEDTQHHEAGHAGMRQALDSAGLVPAR
jgi:hypothetical protein